MPQDSMTSFMDNSKGVPKQHFKLKNIAMLHVSVTNISSCHMLKENTMSHITLFFYSVWYAIGYDSATCIQGQGFEKGSDSFKERGGGG